MMISVEEVHRRFGLLAAIAKVCLLCGVASLGLAFFSTRFNLSAIGFVLVGSGLALLFLRDAFRPKTRPADNVPTTGSSGRLGGWVAGVGVVIVAGVGVAIAKTHSAVAIVIVVLAAGIAFAVATRRS
jgi:hypothetical protein